jgi:phospholipase/lecithinase/hemolysin
MNKQLRLAAFAVSLACACTPALAYTTLFAFGDSLSDAGNLFFEDGGIAPVPPYVDGHFSNGPTWVEDLSEMLGLGALTPFLAPSGGNDFAFGGAQTGPTDINPPNPSNPIHIDVPDQINAYDLFNPKPVAGALYTLDIGGNDIMNALDEYVAGKISLPEVDMVVAEAKANTIQSVKT